MKVLGKAINIIFLIFLAYVLIAKCAYLFNLLPSFFAVGGAVIIFLFIVVIYMKWQSLKTQQDLLLEKLKPVSYKKMLLIILLCAVVTKVILTNILQITSIASHKDIQVYVETAKELAVNGVVRKYADYCFTYSHMFWYALFLTPIVKIFGEAQSVMSLYMAAVSTITLLLVFDMISYKVSKESAFVISLILCFLPSQLLLNQYITHEHALLFFLTIAVWLYFRILPDAQNVSLKILYALLFVLSLFCAYLVNTAGLVMILSFMILFLVEIFNSFSIETLVRGIAKCVVIILVIILGSSFCKSFQVNKSILHDDYVQGDKIIWTLYVGANAETQGHWSYEDTQSFSAYPENATYEEIQQFRKTILIERYDDLLKHPGKLISLIKNKSITIWSCFNYPISFTNETVKNNYLQQIYNRWLFKPLILLEYVVSLLAAIWCFVYNLRGVRSYQYDSGYLITELYLIGMSGMLLLTECNNKYTLAMQPFFWMACLAILDCRKHFDTLS